MIDPKPLKVDPTADRAQYHQLADALRVQIRSGLLKPGDKLPSEEMLGEMSGLGRDAVRDALSVLRGEGYVVTQQGKLSIIREPKPKVTVVLHQGDLLWSRMPYPEERKPLDVGEGIPVLVISRADGTEESYAADCTRVESELSKRRPKKA